MNIAGSETPLLLLDKIKLDNNIVRAETKIDQLNISFRPHGKTAKSIDVLSRFFSERPQKLTVSTLKEAEYYFGHGVSDLVYAVGIAPNKIDRALNLVKRGADLKLIVDNEQQILQCALSANAQSAELKLLIEIDCDNHRGGLPADDKQLIYLASLIQQQPGLRFEGLITHAGGAYQADSQEQLLEAARNEVRCMNHAVRKLNLVGIQCNTVSVGSTPTFLSLDNTDGINEIRAGVFLFFDLVMHNLGVCEMRDIALSVLTSVIGHSLHKNQIICDAGWTALSRDSGTAQQSTDYGYGQVCDLSGNPISDLIVTATNQEHGIIAYRDGRAPDWSKFPVGSQFRILPNHACATASMYRRYAVCQGEQIEAFWSRINGW